MYKVVISTFSSLYLSTWSLCLIIISLVIGPTNLEAEWYQTMKGALSGLNSVQQRN